MNGINGKVVSRANEIASLAARGENLVAACATLSADETQTLQEAVRFSPGASMFWVKGTDMAARARWRGGFFEWTSTMDPGAIPTQWKDYSTQAAEIGRIKAYYS